MYSEEKIQEFREMCDAALQVGFPKYKDDYLYKPLGRDILEEIRDIANYASLLYCRIKEIESLMNGTGSIVEFIRSREPKDLFRINAEITKYLHELGEI